MNSMIVFYGAKTVHSTYAFIVSSVAVSDCSHDYCSLSKARSLYDMGPSELANREEAYQNATGLELMSSVRGDVLLFHCPKNTLLSCKLSTSHCQFYMLQYHRDRILFAARDFGWTEACNVLEGPGGISRLSRALKAHLANLYNGAQNSQPLKVFPTLFLVWAVFWH